jgi:hypothetical protein
MNKLSKSPLSVARHAFALAKEHLPTYAHRYSPKTYTQPQLFVCLVLKTFFRTDYRGLVGILSDFDAMQAYLGLKRVPHYTTLQKASRRLLNAPYAKRLFQGAVRRFLGRRKRLKLAAMDSTGMDYGRRSAYYVRRRHAGQSKAKRVYYSHFAKLEASFDCKSHLILAARMSRGPRPDVDCFKPLLDATLETARPKSMLADAGYDSEGNHQHARITRKVRSFMPATHGRPTNKPLTGRFRRLMKKRLNKDYGHYGQRWQAESGFSMIKRCVADTVQGRSQWSQRRELWLVVITYNILLL